MTDIEFIGVAQIYMGAMVLGIITLIFLMVVGMVIRGKRGGAYTKR